MSIPATQMRPGMVIKHNEKLHSVFAVEHRTPGNLRAFIQAKLRNLESGAMFEHRFRSGDAIDRVIVDDVQMEYLYNDGDDYIFMDMNNFEQTTLGRDILGDAVDYMLPNIKIDISFIDGKPVGVELPNVVEMTDCRNGTGHQVRDGVVGERSPQRPRRASRYRSRHSSMKGRKIRIDTAEGAYMSRA